VKYLKNVVTLELDGDKCSGCGMCMEVCPHNVFALENRKALIRDKDACMECGACAVNCPAAAVSVQAGVGCAYAVLSSKSGGECCCG
jgi:NAD-dependent dihydropyrimidine dehydrogenase PreA subunit